jgi:hypothetical protein
MRRLGLVVLFTTLTVHADVVSWVRAHGGEVQRSADGSITGVNLHYAWVTDADIKAIAELSDLEKLDLSLKRCSELRN